MGRKITNEEFLDKLKNINSLLMPLEKYKGSHIKIKFRCPKGHIFNYEPHSILTKHTGCPICSNHQVLKGYNDMCTTNPSMARMLLNPDDGYKYTENSTRKLYWKCPNCGKISYKTPNIVFRQGLSCSFCSDGISYPERYIISLLNQLGIEFEHDISFGWSNGKRYDFYIKDFSLIIESHGLQHYEERFGYNNKHKRLLSEEIYNDSYKEKLALENGIKHYVQLDCRESKSEYIKHSICDSKLSEIFLLSRINWEKCDIDSTKSIIYQIAAYWNDSIYDIQKLSKIFHLHYGTVRDYLKKATELGMCVYDKNLTKKEGINKSRLSKCKPVCCIETGKIYSSILEVELDGFSSKHISSVCNGKRKTAGGCHWQYVN